MISPVIFFVITSAYLTMFTGYPGLVQKAVNWDLDRQPRYEMFVDSSKVLLPTMSSSPINIKTGGRTSIQLKSVHHNSLAKPIGYCDGSMKHSTTADCVTG